MGDYSEALVESDVAKMKHAVAIAEDGRTGEVRGSRSGDARRLLPGRSDLAAEIGDVRRFDTPSQLMAFLGFGAGGALDRRYGPALKPDACRQSAHRRALIEAAWTYRYPARVNATPRARLEGLPKVVRDVAWKAQRAALRPLSPAQRRRQEATGGRGRDRARDLLWAIGREVAPSWRVVPTAAQRRG